MSRSELCDQLLEKNDMETTKMLTLEFLMVLRVPEILGFASVQVQLPFRDDLFIKHDLSKLIQVTI